MTPLNSYFLQGSPSEQRLVQDLINEQLSIYGQDVVYMPRKIINEKKIIKEAIVSKFDDSFRIEAYISTFDGFGGNGDILSKFGVRSTDEITFVISRERYTDFITPKLSLFSRDVVKTAERPQEGDLIYLPLDNALFEIKYVEAKTPFYQLNNLYVYELRCELFEYEDEIIDTNIPEVDDSIQDFGYIATIKMVDDNVAIGASMEAFVIQDLLSTVPQFAGTPTYSVNYIDIINGGSGYKTPPEVRFKKPGGFGFLPEAEAILDRGSVSKVLIGFPGYGYSFAPEISFISSSGTGAIATAIISEGVPYVGIMTGGAGYSTAPNIYVSNPVNPSNPTGFGSLSNPVYISRINSVGVVTAILAENVGANYHLSTSFPPVVSVDTPIGFSTGDFIYNEIVTGETSGTTAYVKGWDFDNRTLKVSIISGTFNKGENIVGSAGTHKISYIISDDIYDAFAENDVIEEEADDIIDFTERNPFGEF